LPACRGDRSNSTALCSKPTSATQPAQEAVRLLEAVELVHDPPVQEPEVTGVARDRHPRESD
jgi:hypothetical protein